MVHWFCLSIELDLLQPIQRYTPIHQHNLRTLSFCLATFRGHFWHFKCYYIMGVQHHPICQQNFHFL